MMSVLLVAGARPNFIKVLPLMREFKKHPKRIRYTFVHTGQHYDMKMSNKFFKDLSIPKPDICLRAGSGTHGTQTAKVIEGIEKIFLKRDYDLVVVVGDVNSTVAASLAAAKLNIKVAHVEAGLRSFDKSMPEEINRVLTDHLSDFLFITEESAAKNLIKEGVDSKKIFFTGNIIADSYYTHKKEISGSGIRKVLGLEKEGYALVTLHRPSNVDEKRNLKKIAGLLYRISKKVKVIFPVHPRTKKMLRLHGIELKGVRVIAPLGYIDFQALLKTAKFVMTDSGGVQEEAVISNIPCLTLRNNTERPVTIYKGSNELTGADEAKVLKSVQKILNNRWKKAASIPLWDGKTAKRIVKIILGKEKFICKT